MEGMFINVENANFICRGCLCDCTSTVSFNIHSFKILQNKVVCDILSECTSIEISKDDALPKVLCQKCLQDLTVSHNFISRCRKSEQIFLYYLNKNQNSLNAETTGTVSQEVVKVREIIDSYIESVKESLETFPDVTKEDMKKVDNIPEMHCLKGTTSVATQENHENLLHNIQNPEQMFILDNKIKNEKTEMLSEQAEQEEDEEEEEEEENENGEDKGNETTHLPTNKVFLPQNQIAHTTERPHVCPFCQSAFIRKYLLTKHMNRSTTKPSFSCGACDQTFQQRCVLRKHFQTQHNKEQVRTFQCEICEQTFMTQRSIDEHKRTHARSAQFMCTKCNACFDSLKNLKEHKMVHDGAFRCEYCKKTFHPYSTFRNHMYSHTGERPFVCTICSKGYTRSSHLKEHFSAAHSQERPYKCRFCEKNFALKIGLSRHEMTHTGEKPKVCTICNKGFYNGTTMKRHMRTHAMEK